MYCIGAFGFGEPVAIEWLDVTLVGVDRASVALLEPKLTRSEMVEGHEDYVVTVEADGLGNIYWDQWAPEQHDLDVRF